MQRELGHLTAASPSVEFEASRSTLPADTRPMPDVSRYDELLPSRAAMAPTPAADSDAGGRKSRAPQSGRQQAADAAAAHAIGVSAIQFSAIWATHP
jgi:hypothetical protein